MREFLGRDGVHRAREAGLTMAAVLLSFGSAYALRRAAGLTASVEVLAVALALSLSRIGARPEHRSRSARLWGLAVLPVVAVGASEIGTLLLRHPDLGDTLFVLVVAGTVWVRRFGERARRLATFAVLPMISVLIVPGVAVLGHGGAGASRWYSALVALIVFAWVTLLRLMGSRLGWLAGGESAVAPARAPARGRRDGDARFRLLGTTKLALQMGVALAAGFGLGRWLFAPHWSWCVLSAFIVSSANRGREDVAHKAALRVLGAGIGTLGATLISGLFGAGDAGAIVVLFLVLFVAVWLRPLNYAFWAAGMTAALALLYGYYGESGVGMLGSRLLGILLGAAVAVAAAWLLMPIRTADIIRRDIGAALAALDRLLVALVEEPEAVVDRELGFRRAVATLEYHRTLLAGIPAPLRRHVDHLPALKVLAGLSVPAGPAADPAAVGAARRHVGSLRRANGQSQLPDPAAWAQLNEHVTALERPLPASSLP
jgi:hypothetical protein